MIHLVQNVYFNRNEYIQIEYFNPSESYSFRLKYSRRIPSVLRSPNYSFRINYSLRIYSHRIYCSFRLKHSRRILRSPNYSFRINYSLRIYSHRI